MRHLVIPIIVLLAPIGCKRANQPPPAPSDDSAVAPEADTGPKKPDTCIDVEDCAERGTLALLAGDPQSIAMLRYACESDSAIACQNLSTALRSGAVPEDPPLAHEAALRGCNLGSSEACVDLGVDESVSYGGATQDFAAAHQHFMSACEAGNGKGCRYAGVLYHEGSVGAPDSESAMRLFDVGCQLDDPESCFNAGVLIIEGLVSGVELETAVKYMSRACELGDADGCAAVEQIAEVVAAQTSKIPDANLRVGSATVDGFTVESLECRIDGGGGVLGNMALIAALAERKTAIDKCGAKGTMVEVTWTAAGGKITKAEGVGSEGACVAKVLKKLETPFNGECAGVIVLGD